MKKCTLKTLMILKHYVEFSKLARFIFVYSFKNVDIILYSVFKISYTAYFLKYNDKYLVLYCPLRLLFFRGFDQHSYRYRFRLDLDLDLDLDDLTDLEACE